MAGLIGLMPDADYEVGSFAVDEDRNNAPHVAREHGIPAVVATERGTELLDDGQMVTVDGRAGVVREGAGVSTG